MFGGDKIAKRIEPLSIASSYWNPAITINLDDCGDLMRFEMAFTRLLQIQQRPDKFSPGYYYNGPDGIRKYVPPKKEPTKSPAQNNQNKQQPMNARAKNALLAKKLLPVIAFDSTTVEDDN